HAKLNNQPMTVFAKKMLMGHYLEDLATVQIWLTFHAKREHKSPEELAQSVLPCLVSSLNLMVKITEEP
ncbi:MAG: hypothetical protein KAH03_03885, partial [Cocleimonas sp.]|nr:hypothetical protein [Cocleimonas sp.]